MSFWKYSFLVLPAWAAFFALYFRMKKRELKLETILAKCAGTFLAFAGAVVWCWLTQRWDVGGLLALFFGLCMIADGLLEVWFVPGMLCFAAAHGVLAWRYMALLPPTRLPLQNHPMLLWVLLGVWALCVAVAVAVFRKDLKKTGKLLPVFVLYPVVLGLLVGQVFLCAVFYGGRSGWLAAAGMVCFYVSDLMVAKRFFHPEGYLWMEKPIMLLYWGALYLLEASLWL